jgi:hypothetical protein
VKFLARVYYVCENLFCGVFCVSECSKINNFPVFNEALQINSHRLHHDQQLAVSHLAISFCVDWPFDFYILIDPRFIRVNPR